MPLTLLNKRRRKVALSILGIAAFYLGGCFLLAQRLVYPPREVMPVPPGFTEQKLADGTTVWTKLAVGKPKPVVFVFAHGFRGKMTQWTQTMQDVAKDGYSSVTMAMPGHDDSPYPGVGFGPVEAAVIIRAAHWAKRMHPNSKVVLVGVSLGGAACWLAVGKDPRCADGVVTESAFARLDGAVHNWLSKGLGSVGPVLLSPVQMVAASMAKVSVNGVNPIDGAVRWRGKPAAIIHAINDPTVLPINGQMLATAVRCKVVEIPAAHACCYFGDAPRFRAELYRVADETQGRTR